MSDYSSADEVRAERVAKMGTDLGEISNELSRQVTLLHIRWQTYRTLFGTSHETIALLNAIAPAFFFDLERVLWEDVILHMCRVTDKEKPGGKDALTIRRLAGSVSDTTAKTEVESLVGTAVAKTEFARDWRHRRLAHTDLNHALNPNVQPLATASRQHVEDALAAIRDVMNYIEKRFRGCPVLYEYAIAPLGGAESLLARLEDAHEYRKQKLQELGIVS
jgi:hypothetical protein